MIARRMCLLLALGGGAKVAAAPQRVPDPVQWSVVEAPARAVAAGGPFGIAVRARVAPGWHLYALDEPEDGPLPTEFMADPAGAAELLATAGDRPMSQMQPGGGGVTKIYVGAAQFRLRFQLREDARAGVLPIGIAVRYQVCNDRMCLPPRVATIETRIVVAGKR